MAIASRLRVAAGTVLTLSCVALHAPTAAAQAFVPAQGEAYASLLFTNVYANRHLMPVEEVDLGEIDANTLLFDVTYGLTDRLAVSVGLPLVISRYQGSQPHQADNPDRLDDGNWHSTWQDVRLSLRYNAIRRGAFAVTPFVGTAMPSHAYEHWAHAAPGMNLRQVHAGVSAASLLDGITPGLFVQGRYSFMLAEPVADVTPKRSNADVEVGYFLSPEVRMFGLMAAQKGHTGIDIPRNAAAVLTPLQRQHHDRISRDEYVHLGIGTSIALSDRMDVYAAFLKQIAGRNGHKTNRAVSIGLTWALRRPATEPDITLAPPTPQTAPTASNAAAPARKSLVRCLCQKG